MTALKIAAFAAVTATTTVPHINDISVPLLGVPLTAIGMSALGVACAFAWSKRPVSRSELFFVSFASTLVGAVMVSVIPYLVGLWNGNADYAWPKELQPPLALLFGLLTPWIVPAFKRAIPAFFTGLADTIVRAAGRKVERDSEPPVYIPRDGE